RRAAFADMALWRLELSGFRHSEGVHRTATDAAADGVADDGPRGRAIELRGRADGKCRPRPRIDLISLGAMTVEAQPGISTGSPHKWLIAVTVVLGALMAVMDVSVVNVALPHMMGSFAEDLSTITWVATGYAIAQIITTTLAGWLSALVGRKRLYMLSLLVFIAGSVLGGTARTFTQMLTYRVIQGAGGGALIPVALSLLREAFPGRQQATAMAAYGMGVVLAPAIGPVLGGYLTDNYGWPWIFYINVPVSVPALLLAAAFIHDPPYLRRGVRRIDYVGVILLSVGLTAAQIVLERGQQVSWFESRLIILGTVVTAVSLTALVFWELHAREPAVNVRLLRNAPLAAASGIGLVFGVALYGTTFILPEFTQTLLRYSTTESGLVLLPRAAALFVVLPIAGWLYRYIDARLLVLGGILVLVYAYYQLAQLDLLVGFRNLVPVLLVLGAGMPFMFVTLTTVSLSTIKPQDTTDASSLYTLSRTVGGNIGYALTATLIADYSQIHRSNLVPYVSGYNPAFVQAQQQLAQLLVTEGLSPPDAATRSYALVNSFVDQQAAMLAYNDASFWFAMMFLCMVPLVLLPPRRQQMPGDTSAALGSAG
ncbi:MAG: DHA2 family efflux MFS transporter permease subunit, partial [Phycisphaerae bacterium]